MQILLVIRVKERDLAVSNLKHKKFQTNSNIIIDKFFYGYHGHPSYNG